MSFFYDGYSYSLPQRFDVHFFRWARASYKITKMYYLCPLLFESFSLLYDFIGFTLVASPTRIKSNQFDLVIAAELPGFIIYRLKTVPTRTLSATRVTTYNSYFHRWFFTSHNFDWLL